MCRLDYSLFESSVSLSLVITFCILDSDILIETYKVINHSLKYDIFINFIVHQFYD